ncbi:MAG: TadE/TadG family type IV pilus assembly protein [Alsobacter sp.]
MTSLLARARTRLADERGVAAVEFALLLPVMLTMYLGSVEVSQGLSADRKVVLLARTLGDLTTQKSAVSTSTMDTVTAAGSVVLSPLKVNVARMRVTSIAISAPSSGAVNDATVCWTYVKGAWSPAFAIGQKLDITTVPTTLRTDIGSSIVLAEVQYPYKPVIGYVVTGQLTLNERIFMRPRVSSYVTNSDVINSGQPPTASGPCRNS